MLQTVPDLHVDIVVPVYNEEESIESFHQSLIQVIDELPCLFRIFILMTGLGIAPRNS